MSKKKDAVAALEEGHGQEQEGTSSNTTNETAALLGTAVGGDNIQGAIAGQLASSVLNNTSARAGEYYDSYARVDLIKPYFDVEPWTVAKRLAGSLLPFRQSKLIENVDMYGPVMISFTLAALLSASMKEGNVNLGEGTLVGTSMFLAFAYLGFGAGMDFSMCYLFDAPLKYMQVASIVGYGMFSYCIAVGVDVLAWATSFTVASWISNAVLVAASVSLGVQFFTSASNRTNGLIVAGASGVLHFIFYLYLRYQAIGWAQAVDNAVDTGLEQITPETQI